jgi:DNA-binding NtrC family response regulator
MVELKLPRLVDRKEDLVLLQRHFLAKFARQYQKPLTGITRRAQIRLGRHHWPGNVRELENVIGNASMMAEGQLIDVHDLPESLNGDPDLATAPDTDLLTLQEVQQRHLLRVLERVGGNKARAAEVLGVSRTTIYEMLASIDGRNKKPQHSAKAAGTPA